MHNNRTLLIAFLLGLTSTNYDKKIISDTSEYIHLGTNPETKNLKISSKASRKE